MTGCPSPRFLGITLSDPLARSRVGDVAEALRISKEKFGVGSGWVEGFKHHHDTHGGVWRGDQYLLSSASSLPTRTMLSTMTQMRSGYGTSRSTRVFLTNGALSWATYPPKTLIRFLISALLGCQISHQNGYVTTIPGAPPF